MRERGHLPGVHRHRGQALQPGLDQVVPAQVRGRGDLARVGDPVEEHLGQPDRGGVATHRVGSGRLLREYRVDLVRDLPPPLPDAHRVAVLAVDLVELVHRVADVGGVDVAADDRGVLRVEQGGEHLGQHPGIKRRERAQCLRCRGQFLVVVQISPIRHERQSRQPRHDDCPIGRQLLGGELGQRADGVPGPGPQPGEQVPDREQQGGEHRDRDDRAYRPAGLPGRPGRPGPALLGLVPASRLVLGLVPRRHGH